MNGNFKSTPSSSSSSNAAKGSIQPSNRSIAAQSRNKTPCKRCREHKQKCEMDGGGSKCRRCERNGEPCIPAPQQPAPNYGVANPSGVVVKNYRFVQEYAPRPSVPDQGHSAQGVYPVMDPRVQQQQQQHHYHASQGYSISTLNYSPMNPWNVPGHAANGQHQVQPDANGWDGYSGTGQRHPPPYGNRQ
ncbi:hypothetical protein SCHPADRAFT_940102 [Schizopora paradoxa]|uniref:Zn(2)-C6 fungal-type domain-containing protein n=1 Tax=Schizopora paradoxa TaxID=27342 RepID=A0A0H2RQ73_9AGAM|nr:hypothetical protein SCHPADRAFT_940102 [Schizopora paradoxa]